MIRGTVYREAQKLPFERRPRQLLHDGWLMVALLECEEFARIPYDCLRLGHDIAQCAGLSGYRPAHRFLDLFRGLPALIHGLGRKPWNRPTAGTASARSCAILRPMFLPTCWRRMESQGISI